MDIPWDDARLFLAIAEAGSLSAAARRLRVAQPTASRRLAELEARLGEPLFDRGAAGASLTAFGERLLEPARRMAEGAAELGRAAEKPDAAPAGVVRLTAAPGVAFDVGAPFAALLRERLPGVRLEIVSTVRYLDLSRREADLALRQHRPAQRDLLCLAALEFDVAPFVAPAYAARFGRRPRLDEVDWLGWAPPLDELAPNPVLARLIPGFRPSFASDDFLVLLRAAELGLGAIFLGCVRHRFERPRGLVELEVEGLPEVRSGLHLVCAKSALAIPRVRAVAELLAAELACAKTPSAAARRRARAQRDAGRG
ncbi:MAG TPA: LysR family transcriptional regulator [Polyangiaceae bacterium]|nr:LysR family transcriptional regulator [Polyangiaceae bacterium]